MREMDNRVYDAAARGDERALLELLQQDPFLLDRVSYTSPAKTPLHVATMKGHLTFVHEILKLNPQLAEELDSQQSSALHIASARGYVEIVRELLSAAPGMCLSRDCQGRNPLHLAAIKGHVPVVADLVQAAPVAARQKLDRGMIVLHLCVEHCQLEALKTLVPKLKELVNSEDDDGNTILHMAVRDKQFQIIKYLLENTNIDVNASNSKKQTAMAILEQTPLDTEHSKITKILRPKICNSKTTQNQPVKWLTKKRDAIMVVAILIATMAFQAGVSPPSGVWQEDSPQAPNPHRAGESVMAHKHPRAYKSFLRSNTIAFVSSLSTILLLISGLPFRRRLFMWVLMVTMWLSITSVAVTYGMSISVVTPKMYSKPLSHVIEIGVAVWSGVMGILLAGNTIRLVHRWLKKKGVNLWKLREVKHENGIQESV